MNLFRWKGGGVALMHVYVWEHIASLYYRTTEWMFTKLGRDEVLMARHMHKDVLAIFAQGADPGWGKIGHRGGGSPSSKNFFTPEGYSNKPNS